MLSGQFFQGCLKLLEERVLRVSIDLGQSLIECLKEFKVVYSQLRFNILQQEVPELLVVVFKSMKILAQRV